MTQQSRIIFWLISSDLEQKVLETEIFPAILTDHKVLTLKIKSEHIQYNSRYLGYWKLNNSLLYHENYVKQIQSLINKYCKQANI